MTNRFLGHTLTQIDCESNWEQTNEVVTGIVVCAEDKAALFVVATPINHDPNKLNNALQNALLKLIRNKPLDSKLRLWIGGYLKFKRAYSLKSSLKFYKIGDMDFFRLANVHDLDGIKQVLLLAQIRRSDQQDDDEVIKHKIFLKPENVKLLEDHVTIQ